MYGLAGQKGAGVSCPRCGLEITTALVAGQPVETVPVAERGERLLMLRQGDRGAVCTGRIAGDLGDSNVIGAVHREHRCAG